MQIEFLLKNMLQNKIAISNTFTSLLFLFLLVDLFVFIIFHETATKSYIKKVISIKYFNSLECLHLTKVLTKESAVKKTYTQIKSTIPSPNRVRISIDKTVINHRLTVLSVQWWFITQKGISLKQCNFAYFTIKILRKRCPKSFYTMK